MKMTFTNPSGAGAMSAFTGTLRGPPKAPGLEILFEGIIGLAAMSSGLTLVFTPDGSTLGLTLAALSRSPFSNYLWPGLLLAAVVGGLNVVAAALTLADNGWARLTSFIAGSATVVFVAFEARMFPHSPLQVVIAAIGLSTAMLALPRREG
jgi:hypothetical protein